MPRRSVKVLIAVFLLFLALSFYSLQDFKEADDTGGVSWQAAAATAARKKGRDSRLKTSFTATSNITANFSHLKKLSRRPLLVRFNWYNRKNSPIHMGYGGKTAMAILEAYNFQETTTDEWDLLWTMVPQWDFFKSADIQGLPRPWQIHNHCLPLTNYRGISGGKVSQWQLFKCMRKKFGRAKFSYMPESLILPNEFSAFEAALESSKAPWIVKLSTGKRAIGIYLVTSIKDVPKGGDKEQYIAQRYVTDPLLVNGKKFHIRLYLVITSLQPLRAILHREGLVLFAVNKYSEDLSMFKNLSIHLTNAAVADRTKKGKRSSSSSNSMLLSELWKQIYETYNVNTSNIWIDIKDVLTKVVLSEECDKPLDLRTPGTCFDVIGVDLLLTATFKPVLLECNNGPELYTMPKQVKRRKANDLAHRAMLADLIPLVAMHRAASKEDYSSFKEKMNNLEIVRCRSNPGLDGDCWSQEDIDNLWREHYEDRHLHNFERLLPSPVYNKYRTNHHR